MVHGHAGGALHQRLDNQRRHLASVLLQQCFQPGGGAAGDGFGGFARAGQPRIGAGRGQRGVQQRA